MKIVVLKKRDLRIISIVMVIVIIILIIVTVRDKGVSTAVKPEGIEVPVIMYHSILNDPKKANKYIISSKTFEDDLIFLKQSGYKSITVHDLVNYVENGTSLPQKPVIITLDDGYYNNFVYVLPILQKHDMKAVISVVGEFCDIFTESEDSNPNYAHFTWENVRELAESGFVEIGNHTYNMHNNGTRQGTRKKKNETVEQYQKILTEDLTSMQRALKDNSGVTAITFTYPYGYISKESRDIVKAVGFKASLSCSERMNYITRDPACLYEIGRYNRPAGIDTYTFMKKALSLK